MTNDDNVIPFPTAEEDEMTQEEYQSAMEELLNTVEVEQLGRIVAGVLEFLSMRAYHDGPYYILNEDSTAITVVATKDDVKDVIDSLPEKVVSWDTLQDEAIDFIQHSDPGDEQDDAE